MRKPKGVALVQADRPGRTIAEYEEIFRGEAVQPADPAAHGYLDVRVVDEVAVVTVTRPVALNALSGALLDQLGTLVREVSSLGTIHGRRVRAIVLTGAGRSFVAGADVKEFHGSTAEITYDVLVGTAFGCGGFAMEILVYIFNKGQYHPLVRSAVMTSLFGYGLAGLSIFVDIGRYWNMLNVLNPSYWNLNSVLLEVALCIAAYIGVLFLEFFPAFIEAKGGPGEAKGYNKIMFILVAIGVLLPTMHQSSLGTLMVISGDKLSPLWQSGLLPFFNVTTAILMGCAYV